MALGGKGAPVCHCMGTGQEPSSVASIPRWCLAGRCCSASLGPPQVLSMSWQELLSLGFALQSMSNNDRALPAWQLLRPISSVCDGQTRPAAQPWEQAQPLQGSLATLQTWSRGPFAPQLREGGGQRAVESPLTQGATERGSKSHCQ